MAVSTIEDASNAEKIHYSICNIIGTEIIMGNISTYSGNFNGKINISDIPRGMYFIKICDGKYTWTKKLNIQ